MKLKSLGLYMVMVGMLLAAPLAHAGQITATHTIASQQAIAGGTSVTLNITVNNQSASALYSISLDMADLTLWAEPGTNILTVGSLSAGGSTSLVWDIISTAPEFMASPALAVLVNAVDSNGQAVEFSTMSEGQ